MLRVLLVDDEPFILQGLTVLIDWEKEGAQVIGTAANGKEALEIISGSEVELVITDIRMPLMTGLELLETVRRDQRSDISFVVLSGYNEFAYAQQAIRSGCMDYLLKPVQRKELLAVVHKALLYWKERQKVELSTFFCDGNQLDASEEKDRNHMVLLKPKLDVLVQAVEQNQKMGIAQGLKTLYADMNQMGLSGEQVNLNISYLVFQLIHLAAEQDDQANQNEILEYVRSNVFNQQTLSGSINRMREFTYEYAEYLSRLRKNVSSGVLFDIEREIRERYMENLTLKELSQKYFINSAYLGQLFRKKYGQSFKEFLNEYRVEQAASLLRKTDKKVYEIAEEVGYRDLDYFINRFIAVKGCTPARFRKQ